MPVSLDALSTLDLALIASVALLSLVCGGLTLRLQQQGPPSDASPLADTPEPKPDADLQNVLDEREEQLKTAQNQAKQAQDQLKTAQQDAKDAREEAELTLLQLHQVQEELEHYFLLSREQDSLLQTHAIQQKRVQKLLNKSFKRCGQIQGAAASAS